ncbi:MAG: hypothetical protein ACJ8EL_04790 [Rhizomicrobium sp.]
MARTRPALLVCALTLALLPCAAYSQTASSVDDNPQVQQRLKELKSMKKDLLRKMQDFDSRIHSLEAEMKRQKSETAKIAAKAAAPLPAPSQQTVVAANPAVVAAQGSAPGYQPEPEGWGSFEPGKGFVLARGPWGEVSTSLLAYVRYLNQLGLDSTYTDAFGRKTTLQLRQDVMFNKVNLSFKGWLLDPKFEYRVWIWTQQPAQGEGAQVVVGGHLGYHFNDYFNVFGGIAPLPGTRTTNWTYPFWLKVDNRTAADEFFRPSYTMGFWANGDILDDLEYRVMIANNLSTLGVSANQLDNDFSTVSGALWWMPTTGEYGPALGFGDFEGHEDVATLFGVAYTRSREDKQSQLNTGSFENTSIRLSDGTQLFAPNAFNTDGQVNRATYQMLDLNAGVKYEGFSLEGEYYARWISDFRTTGFVPVSNLFDQGYQLQASAMAIPRQLQVYAAGSQVFGQYGKPWDATVGLNWYPFDRREVRINSQATYMFHSPVGGISYPYIVGGTGWIFNTDFMIAF